MLGSGNTLHITGVRQPAPYPCPYPITSHSFPTSAAQHDPTEKPGFNKTTGAAQRGALSNSLSYRSFHLNPSAFILYRSSYLTPSFVLLPTRCSCGKAAHGARQNHYDASQLLVPPAPPPTNALPLSTNQYIHPLSVFCCLRKTTVNLNCPPLPAPHLLQRRPPAPSSALRARR